MASTSRKIQEWHLDDSIRLKLGQSSTVDMEDVLSAYVKKTDIIPSDKIDPSILNPINQQIDTINAKFYDYRQTEDKIFELDLDPGLRARIENLESSIGTLPDNFNETVDTAVSQIVSTEEFKVEIANKVSERIADLSESNENLQNTVTALDTSVTDLENRLGTVSNTLEDYILESSSVLRFKDEKISKDDLTDTLVNDLDTYHSDILSLQNDVNTLQRVNVVNYEVSVINIAQTSTELSSLKNNVVAPILYVPTQIIYDISSDTWNRFIDSTLNEDYIQLDENNEEIRIDFSSYTLNNAHYSASSGLTLNTQGDLLSVTNSTNSYKTFVIGFYGANIQFSLSFSDWERDGDDAAAAILFNVNIDGQAFPFRIDGSLDTENTINIVNLSTGPHRLEIPVVPNGIFKINTSIKLDTECAGLLVKEDIPDASFYDAYLFDDIDYFDFNTAHGTYTFSKPDDFEQIDSNSYILAQFDPTWSEGKVIFSPWDQKLYTVKNRKLICISTSGSGNP